MRVSPTKMWLVCGVVGLVAIASYALAQNQPQQGTAIILPATNTQQMVNLQTSMGPVNSVAANDHDIRVNTLANDTFVVVKDVTDSQIVLVYRVDQLGKVMLADKKRFYY